MLTGMHTLNDSQSQQNWMTLSLSRIKRTNQCLSNIRLELSRFTYPFNLKVCHPSCESLPKRLIHHPVMCAPMTWDQSHYCTPSCNVCTSNFRLVTHYCTPSCTVYTNNLRLVTHHTPSCHVCTSNFRLVTHYCTPSCNVCTNDLRLATCYKSSSSCQVFFSFFSFPFRNKSHFQSQEKQAALTQNT